MANEKVTSLPSVVSAELTDIIYAVQGGLSVQETLEQVINLGIANIILSFAGDPNGNVAGTAYQLLWDTSNSVLYVCTVTGSAATAVWTLGGSVSFPISLALGGTGASLTASLNGLVYSTASAMAILTTVNSSLLSTNSAGAPTWLPLTNGEVVIGATGTNPVSSTLTAGSGVSITNGAGSITIAATGSGGTVTSITASTGITLTPNPITTTGTVGLTIPVAVTSGGTGLTSTTINQLLYSSAANTIAGLASVNRASLSTNSTGIPTWLALTDGQLVVGSSAGSPAAANLTAGPGISIANASNTITISGTGSGIGWTEVTGTTQAMTADNGYVSSNAGLVTLTLPVTAAFGTVISIIGKGAGGWLIAQNASQLIQVGSVASTVGVGGSVSSTNRFDSMDLICTTANTTWTASGGVQGALTIV